MTRLNLLSFGCPCGERAQFVNVGLMEVGRIAFLWTCGKCKKACNYLTDIAELQEYCPVSAEFTIKDLSFLHALRVADEPKESP